MCEFVSLYVYVCEFVCVGVCERERERGSVCDFVDVSLWVCVR